MDHATDGNAQSTPGWVGPGNITSFIEASLQTLAEKKSELDDATATAEKIKREGDERIQEVTKEASQRHLEALDAEDHVREAYNAALTEVLDKKILTAEALKSQGYQRAGGRKGRRPSAK